MNINFQVKNEFRTPAGSYSRQRVAWFIMEKSEGGALEVTNSEELGKAMILWREFL